MKDSDLLRKVSIFLTEILIVWIFLFFILLGMWIISGTFPILFFSYEAIKIILLCVLIVGLVLIPLERIVDKMYWG